MMECGFTLVLQSPVQVAPSRTGKINPCPERKTPKNPYHTIPMYNARRSFTPPPGPKSLTNSTMDAVSGSGTIVPHLSFSSVSDH